MLWLWFPDVLLFCVDVVFVLMLCLFSVVFLWRNRSCTVDVESGAKRIRQQHRWSIASFLDERAVAPSTTDFKTVAKFGYGAVLLFLKSVFVVGSLWIFSFWVVFYCGIFR